MQTPPIGEVEKFWESQMKTMPRWKHRSRKRIQCNFSKRDYKEAEKIQNDGIQEKDLKGDEILDKKQLLP
jgi:hypothetical protein